MNIHEYQAKTILSKYGVAVPSGGVAFTPDEAEKVAQELGGNLWVVKAQIHAGGRGKGGGVKLAKSLDEVKQLAKEMLGMTLVTPQTGPEGKEVKRVYVERYRPACGVQITVVYYHARVHWVGPVCRHRAECQCA